MLPWGEDRAKEENMQGGGGLIKERLGGDPHVNSKKRCFFQESESQEEAY